MSSSDSDREADDEMPTKKEAYVRLCKEIEGLFEHAAAHDSKTHTLLENTQFFLNVVGRLNKLADELDDLIEGLIDFDTQKGEALIDRVEAEC
jgi:hypothetical protein